MVKSELIQLSPEALHSIDIFRSLSYDDRKALVARFTARRYAPGQQIISYHDSSRHVFFVISGRVRATIYSLSGKEITLQDLEAGQMFGELAAIDGLLRSAHVIALTEVMIAGLSAEDFWLALRAYPQVCEAILKRLTAMVRSMSERVFEYSALHVKDRIHCELLRLARARGQEGHAAVITPAPTHSEIASRIGTHREAVTRELNALKQAGLISKRGNSLVICDVDRLLNLVSGALGQPPYSPQM